VADHRRGHRSDPEPPDPQVPRSPSGRIPKWVMDEAAGRAPTEAVPFRAPTGPGPLERGGGGRRRWPGLVLVGVVVAAAAGLTWFVGNGRDVPAAGRAVATSAGSVPADQRDSPPPGVGEAAAPLGTPPPAPAAGAGRYRVLARQPGGSAPVTWSPCRPVHYVVRSAHAPKDGARMISEAVAQVSAATGLRFVADGATTEGPSPDRASFQPARYGDRWAPVLVLWATPDEVPDFGIDVAGEAGAQRVRTPSGDQTYVSGIVYLDPGKIASIQRQGGYLLARAVLLHELGHLVGLAHVNDRREVMFPAVDQASPRTYAAGDLAGLALLGRGACQPDA
jgi:hypothetical protein